jgi:hypothetical protein
MSLAQEGKTAFESLKEENKTIKEISETWDTAIEKGKIYNETLYAEITAWNQQRSAYKEKYGIEEDELQNRLEYSKLMHEQWLEEYAATPNTIAQVLKMESTWQELGNTINSVWTENVKNIVRGSQTASEAFRNFAASMADVFISSVSKMIANWILFQNVQGTYKSGAGVIGIVGSLFGAKEGGIIEGWKPILKIPAFAEGTLIKQPTLGWIGEGGDEEAVVPLKGGKIPIEGGKRGDTFIANFLCNDAKSFDDMVQRNPDSILKVMKAFRRFAGTKNTEI